MAELPDKGFPLPSFHLKAGILQLTFSRNPNFIALNPAIDKKLTDEDRKIILFVQKEKEISVSELAAYLNVNIKYAQRRLNTLVQLKLVKAVGANRWRRYTPFRSVG